MRVSGCSLHGQFRLYPHLRSFKKKVLPVTVALWPCLQVEDYFLIHEGLGKQGHQVLLDASNSASFGSKRSIPCPKKYFTPLSFCYFIILPRRRTSLRPTYPGLGESNYCLTIFPLNRFHSSILAGTK